ncbi:sigma-70 family RNA polymerase sigma factor [Bacteroides salyersiae]|nr:sigma-70 family RNA polymerase sigma factor [Bacteroides salyersiae]
MDEKYILGLRKGSHADFNKLYDLYADRLYGFAYNLTHSSEMAEEIVQEVFLKIWQMREHLSPEYSFRSFLFTIAKNKFLNDLRNRLTLLSYDEYTAQLDAAEEGANTTENDFNFHELNEQILQAKDKLSKRQRTIFEMSREEGLSSQGDRPKTRHLRAVCEKSAKQCTQSTQRRALSRQAFALLFFS